MEFEVSLTPRAGRDLDRIGQYLAQAADVGVAQRFCDELLDQAISLKTLPRRGHPVPKKPQIHRLVYENYLIFYKADEKSRRVDILRFWHAARDQRHLRLKEETPAYQAVKVGA